MLSQQPEHGFEDFLPLQLLLMKIGLAGGGSSGFGTSYATCTRRYNLLADLPPETPSSHSLIHPSWALRAHL